MSNRIIFTNKNGGASVVVMADGFDAAKEAEKLGLTDFELCDVADIPSDRTFRDAWEHDKSSSENKIGVRIGLARDVSLVRVRAERDAKLVQLDKQYAIAQRTGADTAALDAKRQELLDATEALKALDVNNDGIVTVEKAANDLISLEVVPEVE